MKKNIHITSFGVLLNNASTDTTHNSRLYFRFFNV